MKRLLLWSGISFVRKTLATIGGFVGISTAFTGGKHIGGRMNIVNFMDPIIWNQQTRGFGEAGAGERTFGNLFRR